MSRQIFYRCGWKAMHQIHAAMNIKFAKARHVKIDDSEASMAALEMTLSTFRGQ